MHASVARLNELTLALSQAIEEQAWQDTHSLQQQRKKLLAEIADLSQVPNALKQVDFDALVDIKALEAQLKAALTTATATLKEERKSLTKGKAMMKAYGR